MDGIEQVEIMGVVDVQTEHACYSVEWVNYRNRAWLVPFWIESYDGQWLRPVRLIAPKWTPGHTPLPGVEILHLLQKGQVPSTLLENEEAPQAEWPQLNILEGPEIIARNPAAGH